MRRRITVPVTIVALLVAIVVLLLARDEATVRYLLPSPTGATRHTAVFGPGVLAVVVAAVATGLAVVGLVLAILRRLRPWQLWAVLGAVAVELIVLVVVSGLDRPAF